MKVEVKMGNMDRWRLCGEKGDEIVESAREQSRAHRATRLLEDTRKTLPVSFSSGK